MKESRKHFRLRYDIDLVWQIADQRRSGHGRIVDVSFSGLCFRTDQFFTPKAGMIFTLEVPTIPVFPKQATLRWFRRTTGASRGLLCGAIFVKEGLDPAGSWSKWITEQAPKLE